jgi:hypothetical protein
MECVLFKVIHPEKPAPRWVKNRDVEMRKGQLFHETPAPAPLPKRRKQRRKRKAPDDALSPPFIPRSVESVQAGREERPNPILGADDLREINGIVACYQDLTAEDATTWDTLRAAVHLRAAQIHLHGRANSRLSAANRYSSRVREEWRKARDTFRPKLDEALDRFKQEFDKAEDNAKTFQGSDAIPILNATLAYLALPGHVIPRLVNAKFERITVPIEMPDETVIEAEVSIPTGNGTNSSTVDAHQDDADTTLALFKRYKAVQVARSQVYKDRRRNATKTLTSNGTAPRNAVTASILREMHPAS